MDEIEVGAIGGDLPIVVRREAVRQGQLLISAQAGAAQAFETRATALLGWCSAGSIGITLTLAARAGSDFAYRPLLAAVIFMLIASAACVAALWPQEWEFGAYPKDKLEERDYKTEFELHDGIAAALLRDARKNQARLRRFANCLRAAWLALMAAPIFAALATAVGP